MIANDRPAGREKKRGELESPLIQPSILHFVKGNGKKKKKRTQIFYNAKDLYKPRRKKKKKQKQKKTVEQRCVKPPPPPSPSPLPHKKKEKIHPTIITAPTSHQHFTPHAPRTGRSTDHHRAPAHRLHAPRTLKQRAADDARRDAVRRVVFSADVSDGRVHAVIDERQHAAAVAQERPTSRHPVEHVVELQPRRCARRTAPEALGEPPGAAGAQAEEVHAASAVAEVVGPSARRERGL